MQNKIGQLLKALKARAQQAATSVTDFVSGDSAFEELRKMDAEDDRQREAYRLKNTAPPIDTQLKGNVPDEEE